jgi:hypothetical protein
VGSLTSHNPIGLQGLLWDSFTFTFLLTPATGRGGLYGCEMLRIPHCIDSRLTEGGKFMNLKRRPCFTPRKHFSACGTHLLINSTVIVVVVVVEIVVYH